MDDRPKKGFRRARALLGVAALALLVLPLASLAQDRFVYVTTLDTDIVTPVLAQWIEELIKRAEEDGAEALVIQLDTPGGLLTATHDIVKDIMTARVPVIVYVGPSGSRAASAGTFITVAAHVAAMAPGTTIGAAHVVSIDGSSPTDKKEAPSPRESQGEAVRELIEALKNAFGETDQDADEAEESDADAEDAAAETDPDPAAGEPADEATPTDAAEDDEEAERKQQDTGTAMGDKILNDTIAWARTIAEERGRNAEWMEKAIVDSASITEDEALDLNVIDFVAEDLAELLAQADGRTIRLPGQRTVTLHTADATVRALDMTFRYRFLSALAHPQILILLLSLGGLGLTMELFNPNGITGVIGAVCLILAYFGLQTLPINVAGILLLLLSLVLLIAEFKIVSYGLLTLGALVCFTLGGLMLIDSPDEVVRMQLSDVLPITLAVGVVAGFLVTLVVRSQQPRPMAGAEGMIGVEGVVAVALDPDGKVDARGEYWNAVCRTPLPVGARVRVTEMDGLTVRVEPLDGAETAGDAPVTQEEGVV